MKKLLILILLTGIYHGLNAQFKRNLRIGLQDEGGKRYLTINDTIVNRMKLNSIHPPYKLMRIEKSKHSNLLLIEVHSKTEKVIILLDSTNKVVNWSNLIEIY